MNYPSTVITQNTDPSLFQPVIKQAPSIRENLERWKEPASSGSNAGQNSSPAPTSFNASGNTSSFMHSRSSSMTGVGKDTK